MAELCKHQQIELEITGITHKGFGVGRWEGMVVFVPETAPGDRILATVVNLQKSHAFATVDMITHLSDDRETNTCPAFPACGGCSLRHLSYAAECREKEHLVRENLGRIGRLAPEWEPMITSPQVNRYHNKAQYPVRLVDGNAHIGFFAPNSHELIPLHDCLLQPQEFSAIAKIFCAFLDRYHILPYQEAAHAGLVRHLLLRCSRDRSQIMATIVINGKLFPYAQELTATLLGAAPMLKTITLSHNTQRTNVILGSRETLLYGDGRITDTLCGVELELSTHSFYQVNPFAAELLYQKAKEYAAPTAKDVLLDLYCGIGSIGLTMAADVKQLYGIELAASAVRDAKNNALRNQITNAKFFQADAGKGADQLATQGIRPDVIIVDPPRKGLDTETISALLTMRPRRVVYVSCNSATLARDAKLLCEGGYCALKACAVDLFPRTPHVESVLLLEQTH